MSSDMKRISKFLSYVLRHQPDAIGLTLDDAGWADVDDLIAKCTVAGHAFDRALLAEVVATNEKKRFTLSPDGHRIRAAQGHSITVELGLLPVEPPALLYHGTATRFMASIRAQGLLAGSRRQVHLSGDPATARTVGTRHGAPVVLRVAAQRMRGDGFEFFRADNGVWLVDHVPVRYLEE